MEKLRNLQQQFQNYILYNTSEIIAEIVDTASVSAITRLDIYSYAYLARLQEVLMLDFSGLHTLLGDESFEQLCRNYLHAHPSLYRSVRWVGTNLPNFMRNTEPYRQSPILAEMADFEWALQYAVDAADLDPITTNNVTMLSAHHWPSMRLKFHPSLQRLNLQWNVVAISQAIEAETELPELQESVEPVPWIVWRDADLQVSFCSLSPAEAWALDAMLAGETFESLCMGLCEWVDESCAGPYAAELLQNWLTQSLITGMHYADA